MTESLFAEETATYASSSFPPPRPFQTAAHEALRQGVRDGHRCQVLMSPTGSGKTYLGMRIIHEALLRGKRCCFLVDRNTLIEQTSRVADQYGLSAHGIIQAQHWRTNLALPFQIASQATIAARQWPEFDVIVVDECHTQYKSWTEHIPTSRAVVIGLSATPFSQGMGLLFSNLVNAATMADLTESGVLVPMRVFTCTKPDMRGAKVVAGEWSDKEAERRGMDIIGDVVTEWVKFGEGRKTICFGATIAHCEEMVRQFNAAGISAATFTSLTEAPEREALLEEYRKPDSKLRILVSVEALAKGFDCIAEGSMILTDRGHVPIEKLSINDRIWDGCEFVSHDGVIFKGYQDVITYAGLTATPSHLVKTANGWQSFMDCATNGIPIVETAEGGRPVQERDNRFRDGKGGSSNQQCDVQMPLRGVWKSIVGRTVNATTAAMARVRALCGSDVVSAAHERRIGKMCQATAQGIRGLWRAWDRVSIFVGPERGAMDLATSWGAITGSAYSDRQNKQRRSLRTVEPTLDIETRERMQHAAGRVDGKSAFIPHEASRDSVCGQNAAQPDNAWIHGSGDRGTLPSEIRQTKRRVWDVLNAGPRNRFTCEGLLVHNCADVGCVVDCRPLRKSLSTAIQMWGRGLRSSPATGKTDCILLDHSGNWIRFAQDFEDIYFNGLDALDNAEKLDKAVRKDDEEKEPAKCPACGHSPVTKKCIKCGHEIRRVSNVEVQAGVMQEVVMIGKKKAADNNRHLWEQVVTHCRSWGNPDTINGRAYHRYKAIAGQAPGRGWRAETTPNVEITRAVMGKIKQMQIAYRATRK